MSEYRVLFDPAFMVLESATFTKQYRNREKAEAALEAIAEYTLFLHDKRIMPDYSSVGIVEILIDGEWIDVDDL